MGQARLACTEVLVVQMPWQIFFKLIL